MHVFYLNGNFISADVAAIDPQDRGFLLGDGVFTTIRIESGFPCHLALHWERLQTSAQRLKLKFTLDLITLKNLITTLLAHNNLSSQTASLRITLTRGNGSRGLLPPEIQQPTLLITCAPLPQYSETFSVYLSDFRRNEYSSLSQIKTLNYLDNIMARCEAQEHGADEALLLNTQAKVVCGSMSNLFVVINHKVYTASIREGVLPGVMRSIVLQFLQQLNITVVESAISAAQIIQAEEMFLTNALMGIKPVIAINHQAINQGEIGAITKKLQQLVS
ncbi:MAG: aminodeoxychorismate lyase [Coxiellaceae bacterium]|nr:MAG: aminodeoxychorismate lyase [Coxiellaceae bacterium]